MSFGSSSFGSSFIGFGSSFSEQKEKRKRNINEKVKNAIDEYGEIDILVNNAVGNFKPVPFAQLTWQDIQGDT